MVIGLFLWFANRDDASALEAFEDRPHGGVV